MSESLKQKTFKGTIWSAIENFSVQGVLFIVMLIMARLLTPADYGIVGMISIFIAVANSFVASGFNQALVRKIDRTEVDNSTVFIFNIVISIFFYLILFFSAPLIARFYNEPVLSPITRVVGLSLIIQALTMVQRAQYDYKLDFKTVAKASLTGAIISGLIGITMAYFGFGVWSIVIQQLSNSFITTIFLWIYSSWRPIIAFSFKSLKDLFGFGSKLLVSGLIDTIYTNVYTLVIGKVYKAADLGYYTRASSFSQFASTNTTGILRRVTFPILCTIQNDNFRLVEAYRRLIRVSAFLIFPLLTGIAAVSKPMIITLIGSKWIFASILLVPLCLTGMWYPIHALNLNLLQVKGRSDLFLKLEIIKKILGVGILIGTVPLGLYYMCWGSLFGSIISLWINTYYTGKLMNLGFLVQMKDLSPSLILSLVMGGIVWITVSILPFPQPALLTLGILEGALIYYIGAKLFRFPEFAEIQSLLKINKQ